MSYDILKNLGLDRTDTGSPEFLQMLERMQREAWESLQHEHSGSSAGSSLPGAFEQ